MLALMVVSWAVLFSFVFWFVRERPTRVYTIDDKVETRRKSNMRPRSRLPLQVSPKRLPIDKDTIE